MKSFFFNGIGSGKIIHSPHPPPFLLVNPEISVKFDIFQENCWVNIDLLWY